MDKGHNVKIRRSGFPLVPDFGGTAHAYCGSTLDACLGDLLSWAEKPKHSEALQAYIIKSRVRDASKLILAQPYSPHLFSQGEQPGPHMLLDVLLGKMSTDEAKAAWKRIEKGKKETKAAGKWLEEMLIPCRRCTDIQGGTEVRKPLQSFVANISANLDELWCKSLQRGQDLCCFKCDVEMGQQQRHTPVVCCDHCGRCLLRKNFTDEMLEKWASSTVDTVEEVYCKECCGDGKKRSDEDWYQCHGPCKTEWPEHHFEQSILTSCVGDGSILDRKCARCRVAASEASLDDKHPCLKCHISKHISDFGPVACKEWLSGTRTSGNETSRWLCFDCGYPACVKCETENRPKYAVPHNAFIEGKYYCFRCRYPACNQCGKLRENPGTKHRFKDYTCDECRDSLVCYKCGKSCDEVRRGPIGEFFYCSNICRYPLCDKPGCREERPHGRMAKYRYDQMNTWPLLF